MSLCTFESLHRVGEAAVERHADHREDNCREAFLREHIEPEERFRQEVRVAESRVHAGNQHFGRARPEDDKAPKDQGMHRARDGIAEDLRLEDADRQQIADAARNVVPARVVETTDLEVSDEALDARGEEAQRDNQQCEEQPVGGGHIRKLRRANGLHHLGLCRPSTPLVLGCRAYAFAFFTASVSTGRIASTSPTIP